MSLNAAYVTLLTKVDYLAGTLVLNYGLKAVKSKYPLVVMVSPRLPQEAREVLKRQGLAMREIEPLQPEAGVHTLSEADIRFQDTWTKLRAFELTEFERIVLLDSDMIVKGNMDDLMQTPLDRDGIAAVHVCACNPRKLPHYPRDWVPENCAFTAVTSPMGLPPIPSDNPRPYGLLNSGLVVLQPSVDLAEELYRFLKSDPRVRGFKFPDQDLLAAVFEGRWKALPWYYNALRTLRDIHSPLWEDDVARCVHYILPEKPWQTRESKDFAVVNGWWWDQYKKVSEQLKTDDVEGWRLVSTSVAA